MGQNVLKLGKFWKIGKEYWKMRKNPGKIRKIDK